MNKEFFIQTNKTILIFPVRDREKQGSALYNYMYGNRRFRVFFYAIPQYWKNGKRISRTEATLTGQMTCGQIGRNPLEEVKSERGNGASDF